MNTHQKETDRPATDRDFGADVVRIAALILLLWLHFYLRNGFYSAEARGFAGFAAVASRTVFMCCVPLFMILTGYLKCGRTWTASGYFSLVPILASWGIISLIHLPYRIFWRKESAGVIEWILRFFRFELANYSWYVGMYIGLFLLSPLLNLIWCSCRTRRGHFTAVLTFTVLTFLPASVNNFPFEELIPGYFQSVYYITYYLIGCYIQTYRPQPKRRFLLLFVLAVAALLAWANISTRTAAADFYSGFRVSYNGLATGSMSAAIFLLLYRCRTESGRLRRLAGHVSGVVLEIYLLSYIADTNIYPLFYKKYPMSLYLPIGILMTSAVFLTTYPAAFLINRLVRKLCRRGIAVKHGSPPPSPSHKLPGE